MSDENQVIGMVTFGKTAHVFQVKHLSEKDRRRWEIGKAACESDSLSEIIDYLARWYANNTGCPKEARRCITDSVYKAFADGLNTQKRKDAGLVAKPTGWRVETRGVLQPDGQRLWNSLLCHDRLPFSWLATARTSAEAQAMNKPLADDLHAEVVVVPMEKKGASQ